MDQIYQIPIEAKLKTIMVAVWRQHTCAPKSPGAKDVSMLVAESAMANRKKVHNIEDPMHKACVEQT